jgi:hypothetical protein
MTRTVSEWASVPRLERCDIETRPTGVTCLPDEASSIPLELDDGHESLESFGGFLTAQDPARRTAV